MRIAVIVCCAVAAVTCAAAGEVKETFPPPKAVAPGALPVAERAAAMQALAGGGRMRCVWLHSDMKPDGSTPKWSGRYNGSSDGRTLLVFDSKEGAVRTLVSDTTLHLINARFTRDGQRVLYTDQKANQTYVIDAAGGAPRAVGAGTVQSTRHDPARGDLAYLWRGASKKGAASPDAGLWEVPIDPGPKAGEAKRLFSTPPLTDWRGFSVSADGTRGGGVVLDPQIGIVELATGDMKVISGGCYASLAPDNSYRLFHFGGGHRAVRLFEGDGSGRRELSVCGIPTVTRVPDVEVTGMSFLHPRWSVNHPRFLIMTGPWQNLASSRMTTAYANIELYVGRFNETYTKIDGWVQVTSDTGPEFWPDVWVEPTAEFPIDLTAGAAGTAPLAAWPADATGSLWAWQGPGADNRIGNQPCGVSLLGKAMHARGGGIDLTGGSAEPDAASATRIGAALAKAQRLTLELSVVPARVPSDGLIARVGDVQLRQSGAALVLHTGETKTELGALTAGKPVAVQLVFGPGKCSFGLNGGTAEGNAPPLPKLSADATLRLGGDGWAGEVALLHLAAAPRTVQQRLSAAAFMAKRTSARTPAARIEVEATLTHLVPPPLGEMNAYTAALSGNGYRVDKVVSGTLDDKEIVVLQWSALERKAFDRGLTVGQRYRLVLERWEDHPELETTVVRNEEAALATRSVFFDPERHAPAVKP